MRKFCDTIEALIKPLTIKVITCHFTINLVCNHLFSVSKEEVDVNDCRILFNRGIDVRYFDGNLPMIGLDPGFFVTLFSKPIILDTFRD